MAKRGTSLRIKTTRSQYAHKTAKRLEAKRAMIEKKLSRPKFRRK